MVLYFSGVENDNDASILEVNDDNGGDAKQWEYVSDNQERWLRKTPSCMNCGKIHVYLLSGEGRDYLIL